MKKKIYYNPLIVIIIGVWILSVVALLLLIFQSKGYIFLFSKQLPVAAQAALLSGHGPNSYSISMGTDLWSQNENFLSPAQLLEDNRIIGPGNTLHTEIGTQGAGRFSFWKGTLIFSTSDNSDPRTNGRQYVLLLPFSLGSRGLAIAYSWVGLSMLCFFVILWQTLPRIRRRLIFIGLGVSVMVILGVSFRFIYPQIKAVYASFRTQIYIMSFDPAYYERMGSDYCNPRFNPERIGKPRNKISTREYDYTRLALTQAYLWDIDRRTALKYIFDTVTRNAHTDKEKHIAVLRFLQKASYHNIFPPIDPSGSSVNDPLVVLELGEMWCADVARVAVDLFSSAGYKGRIVQLSEHQVAEIFYDNDWHYFDADVFSGGDILFMPDGTIPSVDELSRYDNKIKLDSMPTYYEANIINSCFMGGGGSGKYGASYAYFSSLSYREDNIAPGYYIKKNALSRNQEEMDKIYFGWHIINTVPDPDRVLAPMPLRYAPSIVKMDAIVLNPETRQVHLSFHASDMDNDIIGYRIFISKKQRGWDYAMFYGAKEIKKYWSNPYGWKPEMYDAYHRLPPVDVKFLTTSSRELDISIPEGDTYYVTIMAYDAYGEKVGRKLYPASNEIKLSIDN